MVGAEGLTFGMNALISILFGVTGAVGFWFKIKGSVSLLEQRIKTLEANDKIFNKRIEAVKADVKDNRERADSSITDITSKMQAMELRIITAIHEIKK